MLFYSPSLLHALKIVSKRFSLNCALPNTPKTNLKWQSRSPQEYLQIILHVKEHRNSPKAEDIKYSEQVLFLPFLPQKCAAKALGYRCRLLFYLCNLRSFAEPAAGQVSGSLSSIQWIPSQVQAGVSLLHCKSFAVQCMAWPLCLEDWNLLGRDWISLSMSTILLPRLLIIFYTGGSYWEQAGIHLKTAAWS